MATARQEHPARIEQAESEAATCGAVSYRRVCFRFIGAGVEPDAITSRLQLTPVEVFRKGDPLARRPAHSHGTGAWILDSHVDAERPLADHLTALLDQLEPHASRVRALSSAVCRPDFFVSEFHSGQGHASIDTATLGRIAGLGASLTQDLWYAGGEEGLAVP